MHEPALTRLERFAHLGAPPLREMKALSKHRLEALVDGIFAVAMTLLVLDIKLPGDEVLATDRALWDRLVALERHLVVYAITFIVIGRYWTAHHLQFHFVHGVDRRMVGLNMLYLLVVSFLPFATDLVGDHKDLVLPCEIYGATLLALNGIALLHTRHLRSRPALATAEFTPAIAAIFERRALLFSVVPLASMAIAFLSTRGALYIYFAMVAAYLAGNPIHDRLVRRHDDAEPDAHAPALHD